MATATKNAAHEAKAPTISKEAFVEKMLGVANGAGLALMTSIGHRTGLFDTMAELPPSSSQEIADEADLNERYVREWLGAMVTGEVVIYDPQQDTYFLPPEHASVLTRAASPENLAVTMQFFAILGGVEERVVECFHNGGGVPYSAYHRFHEVMAEESGQTVVAVLLDRILPLIPAIDQMLGRGIEVLDVGCGRGRAIMTLATAFPNSRFTGYDLCDDAVAAANAEAAERGLANVRFLARDMSEVDEPERYDLITAFDAVHDQRDPAGVLANIHKALRPGAVLLMQDIAASSHLEKNLEHPLGTMLYTISCMHCMSVSLSQRGAGLGTCWGQETAQRMLTEAGFDDIELHQLEHDIQNFFAVARKAG